ncbi:GNAT family N-acetyltransferase [Enterovibrio norvegicus]|uniref:GNAT family N-acetyltransferase n=1 Tax=Enterovibrio norvegicus TaxID=188144 RepID=UPI00354FFF7E
MRFPLVARFYKAYYPSGKPKKDEIIWTVESPQGICGAVRFKQFETFQLLTGMLVTPELRRKKLGDALLVSCKEQIEAMQCYCLAFSYLTPLYEAQGFKVIEANALPEQLRGRYASYCNSGKNLIPMKHLSSSQC